MELYLMQHGLALTEEEDPDRPLSAAGAAEVRASAAAIVKMGLRFETFVCSTKTRARQTAALVAEAVGVPPERIVASGSGISRPRNSR